MLINRQLLRSVVAVLVFFSFLTPCRLFADETIPPDSAKVFAAFKAATGGSAWDTVATVVDVSTISQGGLTGVDRHWEDDTTGRFADHIVMDGISSMVGFDGTRAWSADSAGNAHYQDSVGDMRSAITSSYLIESAFLFPNRHGAVIGPVQTVSEGGHTFSVINVVPDGGDPIDLWFDNTSHYLVRTVEHTSLLLETTELSDFRRSGGVMVAFASTDYEVDRKYQSTEVTTSELVNVPLPASIFSIPANSAVDYTINGGPHPVIVPFTFTNGSIQVPVKINGLGPFNAVLDSGASLSLTPEFAKKYNVVYSGSLPGSGVGPNTVKTGVAKLATLQISDITLDNPTAGVLALPLPRDTPLIGAEIFSRFAVNIDFNKMQLILTPLSMFKFKGPGSAVPLHFDGATPVVDGSVDGIPGQFQIDTGSANPVALFSTFVDSNSLAQKYHPVFRPAGGAAGIGGSAGGAMAWAKEISVGSVSASNCMLILSDAKKGAFADSALSGNIGMMFLAKFNLTFDYGHQIIYFQPNTYNDEVDPRNGLGISFVPQDNGVLVTYVFPGSPAAVAGIAAGDLIIAMNGMSLHARDGDRLLGQMLQPDGTVLQLTVETNYTSRVLSITLQTPK